MKKIFVLFTFTILAIFFHLLPINNTIQTSAANLVEKQLTLQEVLKDSNYSRISLSKNITKQDLLNIVSQNKTSTCNVFAKQENLSQDEVIKICDEYDFSVISSNNSYEIYSKYQLKRLIVIGAVDNTYGAINVYINGDLTILSYSSEEETKYAYEMLQLNPNLIVSIDSIITPASYDYSSYKTWGAEAISLGTYNEYFATNTNSTEIVVVVLDTGINTSHEMFKDRLLYENGKIVGLSYEATTYTYSGYSFEDDHWGKDTSGNPIALGHGTHVSGTIADLTPTNVKILPIKVMDGEGSGSTSSIFDGINQIYNTYSSKYNIACLNLSLGWKYTNTSDASSAVTSYNYYFNKIINKNIMPIVAAGNESSDTSYTAPGGCTNSAIVVSALKKSFSNYIFDTTYSNFGNTVDISAPGTNITSASIGESKTTANKNRYVTISGTSMATPHVAAVFTLLCLDTRYYTGNLANYTISEIETRLYECSMDLGTSGKDIYYGHGMVYLKYFNGDITYSVTNKSVTYNGNYHNILVSVTGVGDYSISYGLTSSDYSITNITTNDAFKNYTNGQKPIYFKITADYHNDTYGYGYLTINKADIGITISNQTHTYGNTVNLNNTLYSISSGRLYGTDNLGVTLETTANNKSPIGSNYDITAKASNSNYNLSYTKGKLTINPRPISITLLKQTSEYGDEIVLNSTGYTVTSAIKVVEGDNLNLVLTTNATSSSPVGDDYIITLESYNSNYTITATQGSYEITQKTLIISSSQSGIYGNTPNIVQTNYSCNVALDNSVKITLTTNATNESPVGNYDIYFSCNNSNYKIGTTSTGIYTIHARPITLKAKDQTSIYGNTISLTQTEYELTSGNIVNDDIINVTLSTTASNKSSVGDYSISIKHSGEDANNYNITLTSGILKITKRLLTLSADTQTIMYGNTVSLNRSKFTADNLVNGDILSPSLTTTANSRSPVGDYTITINCSASNYDITLKNGILKITPREITITINNQSGIYGEEINLAQSYLVTSTTKIVNNDNLNIVLSTTAAKGSEVGSYPITLTYNNQNYNVTIIEGTFEITQRVLVITIENQTSTYGDEVILDQTKFSINMSGIDKLTLGIILSTEANKESSVGTYDITATSTSDNFTAKINKGTLTITKRELGITIDDQTNTYGNINLIQTFYTLSNVANNDIVNITLSTEATNKSSVGNYDITASTTNANYSLPEAKGTLTVQKKEIEIVLNNQNGGYYGAILFNENDYSLLSLPINGDNLNITLSTEADNNSSVGNYPITFTFNNLNYSVVGDNATFTVNARPIEVTINQTSVYGEPVTLNANNYDVTSSIKLVSGDNLNLNLSTTANNLSSPGKYDIVAQNNNNNYSVTFVSTSLTITKRQLTITALEIEEIFIYGETVSLNQNRYELSGLINDDKIDVTLTTTATSLSNVGTYPVVPTYTNDLVSEKYLITTISSYLTISKRAIEITIADQETIYGAEIKLEELYFVTSPTQIVNGDNLNIKLKTNATSESEAGEYAITLEYNNDNYDVSVIEGTLTVVECDIIIQLNPQSGIYGNDINLDQNAYTINIDIDKSILGVTLSTNATKTSPVGKNYEISLEYTNKNYTIVTKKTTFEIKPRPITININDQDNIYGEIKLNQTLFSTSEQPLSEPFGISLTTSATATSESGSKHEINFTYSNKNYEITASKLGSLTIKPRPIEVATYQFSSYGNEVKIDDDNYDITSGNVINNDSLNLIMTCSVGSSTPAGQYPISITCGNHNYTLSTKAAIYEILKRQISISISQQNPYGNPISLDGDDYQINAGNLVNNDNLNLVLSTTATITDGVNTYPITIEDSNPNYNISLLQGELTITKRQIRISSIQTAEYGKITLDNENYLILSGSKAFATDELNIKFSSLATNTSSAGNYNLSLSYNNNNYNILLDETNSKLIVHPKNITIKLNGSQSMYGDPVVIDSSYTILVGSVINNDSLNLELTTMATNTSNVGTYYITSQKNNPNYKITLVNNYHTITKRKITVKLQNQTTPHGLMYDIDQTEYEIVAGTVLENTNLDLEIYSNGKQFAFMGKYDLMARTSNENYEIEIIGAKLTITPSLEDAAIVAIVVIIGVSITVTVIKRSRKKKKNQELFDKYIGW